MRRTLVIAALALATLVTGGLLAAGGSDARTPGTVRVTLDEFDVRLDTPVVEAGAVRFETVNAGRAEHELQVLRTDLAPDALPRGLEGIAYEQAGDLVLGQAHGHGEAHEESGGEPHAEGAEGHIAAGASRTDVVTLTPGRYVVLCDLPGHYGAGQSTSLTVR